MIGVEVIGTEHLLDGVDEAEGRFLASELEPVRPVVGDRLPVRMKTRVLRALLISCWRDIDGQPPLRDLSPDALVHLVQVAQTLIVLVRIAEFSLEGPAVEERMSRVRRMQPLTRLQSATSEGPRDCPPWIWMACVMASEGRVYLHSKTARGLDDIVRVVAGHDVLGGPLRD